MLVFFILSKFCQYIYASNSVRRLMHNRIRYSSIQNWTMSSRTWSSILLVGPAYSVQVFNNQCWAGPIYTNNIKEHSQINILNISESDTYFFFDIWFYRLTETIQLYQFLNKSIEVIKIFRVSIEININIKLLLTIFEQYAI